MEPRERPGEQGNQISRLLWPGVRRNSSSLDRVQTDTGAASSKAAFLQTQTGITVQSWTVPAANAVGDRVQVINSANRGSAVSRYRAKAENNDSRSPFDRGQILRFARIMFRRLGDEGAADVAGSRGSRFIVESFATIPRKTNRLSSNFVTPARLLPGVSCCTRGSRRVKIWKPRHCLGRCCSVTWTR